MAARGTLFFLLAASFAFPVPLSQAVVLSPPHEAASFLIRTASRVLTLPGNEVHGESVSTGPGELLQVLFADGSALTLGQNSEASIDSFVFDPAANTARLTATLKRGVFRFIGGRTTATADGVSLQTPFGTLSMSQASADISLGGDGQPPHFDLVFGASLTLSQGGSVVARVRQPGYSIAPQQSGGASASVRKTPSEWRKAVIDELT